MDGDDDDDPWMILLSLRVDDGWSGVVFWDNKAGNEGRMEVFLGLLLVVVSVIVLVGEV